MQDWELGKIKDCGCQRNITDDNKAALECAREPTERHHPPSRDGEKLHSFIFPVFSSLLPAKLATQHLDWDVGMLPWQPKFRHRVGPQRLLLDH